jgi:hypothetical protein
MNNADQSVLGTQRRVVCAAIRAADGTILLCIRHYDMATHAQIASRLEGEKFKSLGDSYQGFVDQYGFFMSRKEAYKVALAAGQIIDMVACQNERLYSEGLY